MRLLIAAILSTIFFISVLLFHFEEVNPIFIKAAAFFEKRQEVVQINSSPTIISSEQEQKSEGKKVYDKYEITAYTAGPESTGKSPGHPAYGITASGKLVQENYTIACPPELSFGTIIYIPFFNETFICEDRGGAIKGKTLDIYMENVEDARQFGRRVLDIVIVNQSD